jgi:hypothetical protein
MKVNVGGTLKPVVRVKANIGGTLKTVVRAKHNVAGTIKAGDTFTPALSLSVTPSSIYAVSNSSPVISEYATATPTGGLAPYTYSWVRTSGAGSISSPSSSVTSFSDSLAPDNLSSGTFTCTVTDNLGATASGVVEVEFERTSFS